MKGKLAAALVLAATAAQANPVETCARIGGLAETIMMKRQEGVHMSAMMEQAPPMQSDARDIVTGLILQAFTWHRYMDPVNHRRAAHDFRTLAEADCFRLLM
jgi:hypothetical protein